MLDFLGGESGLSHVDVPTDLEFFLFVNPTIFTKVEFY